MDNVELHPRSLPKDPRLMRFLRGVDDEPTSRNIRYRLIQALQDPRVRSELGAVPRGPKDRQPQPRDGRRAAHLPTLSLIGVGGKIGRLTIEGLRCHFSPERALVEGGTTATELVLHIATVPNVEELTDRNKPGQFAQKTEEEGTSASAVAADIEDLGPVRERLKVPHDPVSLRGLGMVDALHGHRPVVVRSS
jgi:hypothetical protein